MAKQINTSIGGVVKKVSKVRAGVGGVVKTVKKGVCSIGGVVKTFFLPFNVVKYVESNSTDTSISSQSVSGSEGTLSISLSTIKGGGTSETYNGCALGARIYEPDDGWDGQTVSFTLDITGYVEYYAHATIVFGGSSGVIKEYDLTYDCTKSYTIPTDTTYILLNVWTRYERTCSAVFTNFTINGELVDWSL